jgi:hypothetical protein
MHLPTSPPPTAPRLYSIDSESLTLYRAIFRYIQDIDVSVWFNQVIRYEYRLIKSTNSKLWGWIFRLSPSPEASGRASTMRTLGIFLHGR